MYTTIPFTSAFEVVEKPNKILSYTFYVNFIRAQYIYYY